MYQYIDHTSLRPKNLAVKKVLILKVKSQFLRRVQYSFFSPIFAATMVAAGIRPYRLYHVADNRSKRIAILYGAWANVDALGSF